MLNFTKLLCNLSGVDGERLGVGEGVDDLFHTLSEGNRLDAKSTCKLLNSAVSC